MHEYLTPPPYTTITACNVAQPLGKAVRGVRYHIPAAKRVGGFRQSSLDFINTSIRPLTESSSQIILLPLNFIKQIISMTFSNIYPVSLCRLKQNPPKST